MHASWDTASTSTSQSYTHPIIQLLSEQIESRTQSKPLQIPKRAKTVYEPKIFYDSKGENILAALKIHDGIPILAIYTSDKISKAKILGECTAKHMMDFYMEYVRYMPKAAEIRSWTFFTDAKLNTVYQSLYRQLDFSLVTTEVHYLLLAFNQYVMLYNKTQDAKPLPFLTLNDMRMMIALCDVYKGIGCSAAVYHDSKKETDYLVRNLDWASMQVLANHTLALITHTDVEPLRTKFTPAKKPRAVFSFGFTPGILGFSMVNDSGLVLTINEATKHHTKRVNSKNGAVPQFLLIRELAENCATVNDVINYLQLNGHPATSHIMTAMDAEHSKGVFELMPNQYPYNGDLFRFRGVNNRVPKEVPKTHEETKKHEEVKSHRYQDAQCASNHFLNEYGNAVHGSEGSSCSFDRHTQLANAINAEKEAMEIIQASNVEDTVHTMIISLHDFECQFSVNVAHNYSAKALNGSGVLQYTQINLSELFKDFMEKSELVARVVKCSDDNAEVEQAKNAVHKKMLELQKAVTAYAKDNVHFGLAVSELYTLLMHNLTLMEREDAVFTYAEMTGIIEHTLKMLANLRIYREDIVIQEYEDNIYKIFDKNTTMILEHYATESYTDTRNKLRQMAAFMFSTDLLLPVVTSSPSFTWSILSVAYQMMLNSTIGKIITGGIVAAIAMKAYRESWHQAALFSAPVATLENVCKKIDTAEQYRMKPKQ